MVKSEKELLNFYKKYIDIPLFRVVPICDYKKIILEGILPCNDPYVEIKPFVIKFERIVRNLEDEGVAVFLNWGSKEVIGSYALAVTLVDFSTPCVDFSPSKESVSYYIEYKGGAATTNLLNLIKKLREKNISFSKKDAFVIDRIETWAKKRACTNKAFYVFGHSKCFETALFQFFKKSKSKKRLKLKWDSEYFESPFGSFNHFKKVVKKHGLRKYSYYLRNKSFFLRAKDNVCKSEIIPLKV